MAYYETSSSEEEDTPSRKKTKMPGGTAGTSNLADECVPFTLEDYPGEYQKVTAPRQTTKVSTFSLSPIHLSYPIKDSK